MGTALTGEVGHLVLHGPSLGLPYPPDWIDQLDRPGGSTGWIDRVDDLIAAGDLETAIVMALRNCGNSPTRGSQRGDRRPGGPAASPQRRPSRETRAEQDRTYGDDSMSRITAPMLFLSGTDSPTGSADHPGSAGRDPRRPASDDGRSRPDRALHPPGLVTGIMRDFVAGRPLTI